MCRVTQLFVLPFSSHSNLFHFIFKVTTAASLHHLLSLHQDAHRVEPFIIYSLFSAYDRKYTFTQWENESAQTEVHIYDNWILNFLNHIQQAC